MAPELLAVELVALLIYVEAACRAAIPTADARARLEVRGGGAYGEGGLVGDAVTLTKPRKTSASRWCYFADTLGRTRRATFTRMWPNDLIIVVLSRLWRDGVGTSRGRGDNTNQEGIKGGMSAEKSIVERTAPSRSYQWCTPPSATTNNI